MSSKVNRDKEAKQASEAFEKAAHRGPDREAVAVEALSTPIAGGLPTTWHDAAGKVHLQGPNTIVRAANSDEVANYGFAHSRVCGTCKYFDLESGRVEIVRQRFGEKLAKEYEWSARYLGVPLDHVALCGASGGSRACTSISNAGGCDQYRERAEFARKRRGD